MNDEPVVTRRTLIRAVPVAVAAGLAGCTGGVNGSNSNRDATQPGTITRVSQLDRAAIVHIQALVSGTAVWPSYTLVDAAAAAAAATSGTVVGTWQTAGETVAFTPDGQFSGTNSQVGPFSGLYTVQGPVLVLQYQAPIVTTSRVQYAVSGGGLQITGVDGITYEYQRVDGAAVAGGPTDGDIVSQVANLQVMKDTTESGRLERREVQTGGSGTGFIVSPDGYIVTNAHVVLTGRDFQQMLLQRLAGEFRQELLQEASAYYRIPDGQRDQIVEILFSKVLNYFLQEGQISGAKRDVFVLNGVGAPGENLQVRAWPADIRREGTVVQDIGGQPTWGRDVAIIKVERDNLPSVTVGDSDTVEVGQEVFIIGYPGFRLEQFFSPDETLEPTVTRGVVSARRTLGTGIEAIQTDAAINSGNSGGPVYNMDGEVIGIATFGAGPEQGIEAIKFALPVNLATEFLRELNVENTSGEMDQKYEQALEAYWRGNCRRATTLLGDVQALYPGHPYAQDYIDECRLSSAGG